MQALGNPTETGRNTPAHYPAIAAGGDVPRDRRSSVLDQDRDKDVRSSRLSPEARAFAGDTVRPPSESNEAGNGEVDGGPENRRESAGEAAATTDETPEEPAGSEETAEAIGTAADEAASDEGTAADEAASAEGTVAAEGTGDQSNAPVPAVVEARAVESSGAELAVVEPAPKRRPRLPRRPSRASRLAPEPADQPATPPPPSAPHVLIIGGGGTGGALAHDLALRGLRVTVVERGEVTSGTTGRHQGLLHSGARFVTTDRAAAIECSAENKILRRIAPGSFEENDGLFVALTDEDADFETQFLDACWQCAVPTRRIDRAGAMRLEPGLNPALRLAVQVPDATMDAMRLPLRFFATARRNGAEILPFTEVTGITRVGRSIRGVAVRDHAAGREYQIGADIVVNAAGPWAGKVADMARVPVALSPSAGVMVSVRGRLCNMVVSRLHAPGDGDVVVPQRQQTVLGTGSWAIDDPDDSVVPAEQIEAMVLETSTLLPAIRGAEIRARWTAARLVVDDGRAPSETGGALRTLCLDHATDLVPIDGFVTIAGGTATVLRATAEVAADLVCRKLGVDRPCETSEIALLPHTAWYSR
jgi:glycerol-3-phosphate dehydrogenase